MIKEAIEESLTPLDEDDFWNLHKKPHLLKRLPRPIARTLGEIMKRDKTLFLKKRLVRGPDGPIVIYKED